MIKKSYQRGLLEALEADVVLVQQLAPVEVRLVVVGGDHHLLPHLAVVRPVREDDVVHLMVSSEPHPHNGERSREGERERGREREREKSVTKSVAVPIPSSLGGE